MLRRIPRPILLTLIYYIVAVLLGVYFNTSKEFKSGPCTPNLDLLWPFLIFLISIVLALIYFMMFSLKKGRVNLYVALVHSSVLAAFVILFVAESKLVH